MSSTVSISSRPGQRFFCLYDDRPGVIASISRKLADAGINIEDMRNPHNAKNASLAGHH